MKNRTIIINKAWLTKPRLLTTETFFKIKNPKSQRHKAIILSPVNFLIAKGKNCNKHDFRLPKLLNTVLYTISCALSVTFFIKRWKQLRLYLQKMRQATNHKRFLN
jgi:hypothetical protein